MRFIGIAFSMERVETVPRCITDFYHVRMQNTVTKQIFAGGNSIHNSTNLVWISMTL